MKFLLYKIYKILPVRLRFLISYLFATKFIVGVSALVVKNQRILLLKNSYQYYWALPGGYLNQGEDFKKSIERELKEETGLIINMEKVLQIKSVPERPVIDVLVLCKVLGGELDVDKKEVEEAKFFDFNDLPEKESMPEFQLEYFKFLKNE